MTNPTFDDSSTQSPAMHDCYATPLFDTRVVRRQTEIVKMLTLRASAIILLTSVLLLFLVPAPVGSFSAVHGPVTALRANRAAHVFYLNLSSTAGEATLGFKAALSIVTYNIAGHIEPLVFGPHPVIRC
jgi:hypothetical protein